MSIHRQAFALTLVVLPIASFAAEVEPSYTNYVESLFTSVNELNVRLDRQMTQLRDRFTGPKVKFTSMTEDDCCPEAEERQTQCTPWKVYFGGTADVGRQLTQKHANGYHYTAGGAEWGFDYAFSDVGVGFLFDYDHIAGRVDDRWGKFKINQVHGSFYLTYIRSPEPQLSFNWILGGGYDWYNIDRNTSESVAKGTPRGLECDALVAMEYTFEQKAYACMPDHLKVVPQLNLQYMYVHVNKYREEGAGSSNQRYNSQNNIQSLRTMVGLRTNYSWFWTNVVFTPEFNLGWQWEFFDQNRHIDISGMGFKKNLLITKPGRNVALGGVDFLVTFFDKYGIEASYDFEWNKVYLDHSFYLGCNFKF
ncbi:MAG TPA: autotransporter outer membrane beta-barrel domain-containing protein [Rhabdochlamydiaceae bacterium]|nr:autotransporter outer membrane beta-barrel domain-containing protein [Rhabdochlamydiaceae bacterium]